MAKFIIEIRSKGFTNAKKRIDETTISLRKQATAASFTRKAVRNLNKATSGFVAQLGIMRNKLLVASFVTGMFTAALSRLTKVTRAAELEDLTKGFTSLRVEAGLTANTLEKLRAATNNTVTDMELMRQANNAMLLGVARSTDELAEMFDNAQRLGRVLGKDATTSLESFVTGLGRQSRLMLDNVGLMIKTNEAYEAYADANKTTVAAMSDMEKKIAFINAGLEQSREKVAAFGEEVESSSDKIRTANVQIQRLFDSISIAIAPAMEKATISLGEFARDLSLIVKVMNPAVFATRELETQAHALKMEIVKLKTKTNDQSKATKELTDEEKKLKIAQDQRIGTLKFAIIDSKALLGVEKEMLKEKLKLRDAISSQEMALLSLLDTQSLLVKLQGKEEEFAKAQAEIKGRHAQIELEEQTLSAVKRLENMMIANDNIRTANIDFLDGEIQREIDSEDEKARIRKQAEQNLADKNKAMITSEQALETQLLKTAAATTTIASGLRTMMSAGASAEDQFKALLGTLAQLVTMGVFSPGGVATGGSALMGSILSAFTGHTGGLIQDNGIQRFAKGGMVQGGDNVPILAQSGEFIMQRSAVENIGLQNLAQMNSGAEPTSGLTINIAGDMVGDEDHIRTKVLPAIKEELRREANA